MINGNDKCDTDNKNVDKKNIIIMVEYFSVNWGITIEYMHKY